MGKSKSITDKEIVIVDGKPMWKSDYKKLIEREKNAKFMQLEKKKIKKKQIFIIRQKY